MKKPWKQYISFCLTVVSLALIGSFIYVNAQPDLEERMALYVTIAAEPLDNENSSYELQRAAEHFSDMVLGWTVEPGFALQALDFTARRQEKQNLLFMINSSEETDAVLLLSTIEGLINQYNVSANSKYVIALSNISEADEPLNSSRIILGALLLALIASGAVIFTYDTYISYRR